MTLGRDWDNAIRNEVGKEADGCASSEPMARGFEQVQTQRNYGDTVGMVGTCGSRRPTPAEEAEKSVAYHYAEAERAGREAKFFREHPEFSLFIEMIRRGDIRI